MTHQARLIELSHEVERVIALPLLQKAKAVDGVVHQLTNALLDMAMDVDKLNKMAEVLLNGE